MSLDCGYPSVAMPVAAKGLAPLHGLGRHYLRVSWGPEELLALLRAWWGKFVVFGFVTRCIILRVYLCGMSIMLLWRGAVS